MDGGAAEPCRRSVGTSHGKVRPAGGLGGSPRRHGSPPQHAISDVTDDGGSGHVISQSEHR